MVYQSGFGNNFATEAVSGALPVGRNSPQRTPHGLYAEVLSGTAFTAPRAENHSTWLYKLRPSAMHGAYRRIPDREWRSGPFHEVETPPNRLRWNPFPIPEAPADFIDGLLTVAGSGDPASQAGLAVHVYRANRSMSERYLWNADAEMMFMPQQGAIVLFTELGRLELAPGVVGVVPRGMKFKVELVERAARGYVCENYGPAFRLPELGPIGSQGLAQQADFQSPVAAFEDAGRCEVVAKFMGALWASEFATFAARRRGLARRLRALPLRARALHGAQHGELRPSRPVDLHGAYFALAAAGRGELRLRRSSRRAGRSPRIRSARPGFTAT